MDTNHLEHHGIIGQKWGIRRYQNPDGSLTPAGRKRYLKLTKEKEKAEKKVRDTEKSVRDYANRNYFLRGEDGFARRQMKAERAKIKFDKINKKLSEEYKDVPLSEIKKAKEEAKRKSPDERMKHIGGEGLSRDVSDIERIGIENNKDPSAVLSLINYKVATNPAVEIFNESNNSYKKLSETNQALENKTKDFNKEINEKLIKKYGNNWADNDNTITNYIVDGAQMMDRKTKSDADFQALLKEKEKYSNAYEKDARKFAEEYFGDNGHKESIDPTRIKYSIKDGSTSQQTINDIIVIEMLRNAGGNI